MGYWTASVCNSIATRIVFRIASQEYQPDGITTGLYLIVMLDVAKKPVVAHLVRSNKPR